MTYSVVKVTIDNIRRNLSSTKLHIQKYLETRNDKYSLIYRSDLEGSYVRENAE